MDVLYEDERIIVVDKPHFLATMPRGMWYRQTALIRLRERLGEPDITPAHRLDRMTARRIGVRAGSGLPRRVSDAVPEPAGRQGL